MAELFKMAARDGFSRSRTTKTAETLGSDRSIDLKIWFLVILEKFKMAELL
jgi:hypothetical protein